MPILVFIVLLLLLYLSSLSLSRRLGQSLYRLTGSKQLTIYLLALFFLPGTLIHEHSHLLVATFLGVRTGTMELIPQAEEEGRIIMGSVPIASTDRIRRAIIGAAPFFVGISLLLAISWWLTTQDASWGLQLLAAYLSLEIGTTCFASQRDLEGTAELLLALVFLLAALYFLGLTAPVNWLFEFYQNQRQTIWELDRLLIIPVSVNLLTLGATRLLPR
jgi:hypothetical protein